MTRINANIPPSELKRMHLIAEYREITMVPAALHRSLRSKTTNEINRSIPMQFTLNTGHVSFFYDKLAFLQQRFDALVKEMQNRGYKTDTTRRSAFDGFEPCWYGQWVSKPVDDDLVRSRIALRISEKPWLYLE